MEQRLALIVDDEPAVRSLVCAILQRDGFRTLEAEDGAQAVRVIQEAGEGLHVLVTDIRMPGGVDGLQLADLARESLPALPVVVISGYADAERNRRDGLEFLQKPFQAGALLNAVRRALSN